MQIVTNRLILNAATPEILSSELAFLRDESQRQSFANVLGAQVGAWPPLYNDTDTCAYALGKVTRHPDLPGWWSWHLLLKQDNETPLLVGLAGFHGPPNAEGSVEIGYSVVETYQRQGIASETVNALSKWAFSHTGGKQEVNTVTITTLDTPELVPSSKVALKCGFVFTGTRQDVEGTLLVYAISREEFAKKHSAVGERE